MSDSESETKPKKRGRKPKPDGAPVAHRAIFYVVAGNINNDLVQLKIKASNENEALNEFKNLHPNAQSILVEGPFYNVRNVFKSSTNNKVFITLPFDKTSYTNEKLTGIFRGWKVVTQGLKSFDFEGHHYEDNDLFHLLQLVEPITEGVSKPRLPKNGFPAIKAEDLTKI